METHESFVATNLANTIMDPIDKGDEELNIIFEKSPLIKGVYDANRNRYGANFEYDDCIIVVWVERDGSYTMNLWCSGKLRGEVCARTTDDLKAKFAELLRLMK